MLTPNKHRNIELSHPYVKDAYLANTHSADNKDHTVLVIETYSADVEDEATGLDPYILDLLTDLHDLKEKAMKSCGSTIEYIDICRH